MRDYLVEALIALEPNSSFSTNDKSTLPPFNSWFSSSRCIFSILSTTSTEKEKIKEQKEAQKQWF